MIRVWLTSALVLATIGTLLIVAARWQPQNPNPATAYLTDCALPCWRGVQPGTTLAYEAELRLNAANQITSSEAPCEQVHPYTCLRDIWSNPNAPGRYTELEIDAGHIGSVVVVSPGFTLGAALLALNDQYVHLSGVDSSLIVGHRFDAEVMFADAHLVMEAVAPCQGSYFDLLQTPIDTLEIDAPQFDNHYVPIMTFGEMRRLFYEACAPALQ